MYQSASMRNIAYFTICSANYLAYALTLAASLGRASPGRRLHVFLADRLPEGVGVPSDDIDLIQVETIAIEGLADMAFRYSILEFNTAVKPYCFEHLLAGGFDAAVYLDPDILVLNPLDRVHEALEDGASCILTPHITSGVDDGKRPNEDTYLTCGVFNLGFAAFSNSPEALSFLHWWGGKTRRHCLVDLERGVFTDQSYCDLAPCFIDRFVSLRDTAYNLAYWNLMQRQVALDGDVLTVDGSPARFIHFSGIAPDSQSVFSRHQNRFTRRNIGALKQVADWYVAELNRLDAYPGGRYSEISYAFAKLSNGDPITDAMRSAYRVFADELPPELNPFDLDEARFIQDDKRYPRYDGTGISVIYAAIWENRSDLRARFDVYTQGGRAEFLEWAQQHLVQQTGMSSKYLSHRPTPQQPGAVPAPDVAPGPSREELFDKALNSTNFMIRNLIRRYMLGKKRTRAYWQSRIGQPPPAPVPKVDTLEAGIDVFGYFRSETGIGQAARGFASALEAEKVLFNTNVLAMPTEFDNSVDFADVRSCETTSAALICANADTTMHLERLIDPRRLHGHHRIGHWAWELPVFPAAWSAAFDRLDEIWVPSRYVGRAVRSATSKTVRIVPYVVQQPQASHAAVRGEFGLTDDAYVFLTAFDMASFSARKNPLAVIRAFQDAFPDRNAASPCLVVKFHGAERSSGARSALAEAIGEDRRIVVFDGVFS